MRNNVFNLNADLAGDELLELMAFVSSMVHAAEPGLDIPILRMAKKIMAAGNLVASAEIKAEISLQVEAGMRSIGQSGSSLDKIEDGMLELQEKIAENRKNIDDELEGLAKG